ncbi:hypothetical protein FRB90_008373 [Tulasnella sp. 427]|nr:hypothetical protein FRB90_008373 [Tulasnella sp. 427]
MPVPKAHYRVALGELDGDHSWIIQSSKGLTWNNIPDALASLLRRMSTRDILDFSLGSDGRFYIRYNVGGEEKRKLSKYLWDEIDQNPNVDLDRLTLGPDGQHWGVRLDRDGSCRSFERIYESESLSYRLDSKLDDIDSYDELDFLAIGADGDWAFGINGRVESRGGNYLRKQVAEARASGKTAQSAAMSPLNRSWFICWDDGTVDYLLPGDMTDDVDDYCQLRHSLIPKTRRGKTQPMEYAISARVVSPVMATTFLRLLDPGDRYDKEEFGRVLRLFRKGWKHSHKAVPDVHRIFVVDLPDHLERPYLVYRSRLERNRGESGVNEKLVFHGTPRHCLLGDEDRFMQLCKKSICSLCGILRQSFSISRAGTAPDRSFLRADDYTNDHTNSSNRALVVAKAALGKAKALRRNAETLRSTPDGYDSVFGEIGIDLNYDEQVLFHNDAIRPAYVIIYEP